MRLVFRQGALVGLLTLVLSLGVVATARAGVISDVLDTRYLLRQDGLAVRTPTVDRLAVHAPGQYASEVLAVFKLRFGRFMPELPSPFGLDLEMLRPYLLGGRAVIDLPVGRTVGERLPGAGRSTATHIGGGAEVRLRERLFMIVDVGEVVHSGALSDQSYTTCRFGFLVDF